MNFLDKIIGFNFLIIFFTCNLCGQGPVNIDSSNFIIQKAGFNNFSGGEIIREVILKSPGLKVIDTLMHSMYEIKSFTMTKIVKGKNPREFINDENGLLTEEMKREIKNSPVGTKLYFEHIKCIDKKGRIYSVYASSFIIN